MNTGPTGATGAAASGGSTASKGSSVSAALSVTGAVTPDPKTEPEPPKLLRPKFERMPAELKERPNWVLWVPIWNGSNGLSAPFRSPDLARARQTRNTGPRSTT